MQAHEMMIHDVYKVMETDSVRAVIKKFIEHRISGVPVVNHRNEIIAYVSDGDIMRYIGKHKDIFVDSLYTVTVFKGDNEEFDERIKKILDLNVLELAKRKVEKIQSHKEIEEVAAILGKKRIKKLPVERDGVLVGIISRGDVIRNTFKSIL
ncbi:CBS domain-containing protein [Virgibacillus phasianinus]|uniref:CBS domain-containing protein n=1 Tax=Virgibacillus phasianinus TaxID=2017483 RepID=A0A220U156_9BACI|nr:CBS domain-containing protein [Virgibacillus phasianinus]ASK61819.1 CBS domain-containing protein [Virgibacillus phasianinus]